MRRRIAHRNEVYGGRWLSITIAMPLDPAIGFAMVGFFFEYWLPHEYYSYACIWLLSAYLFIYLPIVSGRHWIWGEKGGNHRGLPKCASMRTEKLSCNWRSRKNQWCLVKVTTVGKKLSRNRRRGEDYLHSMVLFRLSFSPMRGI